MAAELVREGTDTGTNFQHPTVRVDFRAGADLLRHPGRGEKVLPLGFGKSKSVALQQRFDLIDVTKIHKKTAFRAAIVTDERRFCNFQFDYARM